MRATSNNLRLTLNVARMAAFLIHRIHKEDQRRTNAFAHGAKHILIRIEFIVLHTPGPPSGNPPTGVKVTGRMASPVVALREGDPPPIHPVLESKPRMATLALALSEQNGLRR